MQCKALPIPNGKPDTKCLSLGCKLSYECNAGHKLLGGKDHYCKQDGSWLPKPTEQCMRKYCIINVTNKTKQGSNAKCDKHVTVMF